MNDMGKLPDVFKLSADMHDTVATLLKNDIDYNKGRIALEEAQASYDRLVLTKEQCETINAMLDAMDEEAFTYHVFVYKSGLIDGQKIFKLLCAKSVYNKGVFNYDNITG